MSPTFGFTMLFIAWVIAAVIYFVSAQEMRWLLALVLYGSFILLGLFGVVHESMQ